MGIEAGHWVTIDEHPVFIREAAGSVPKRLQATTGGKRFSKAALERHMVEHHEAVGGGTHGVSAGESAEFERAGRGMGQTTFHKKLPGEVNHYLEGNPNARRLFRVTQNAGEAGGLDAMHDLGEDKYFAHIDQASGNKIGAALETARNSNDPEVRFLAHVHDNLPEGGGRGKFDAIKAGGLRVGDEFNVNGERFRVAQDSDGYRVLESREYNEPIPVDALKEIPADKGSFKPGKRTREAIPFSGAVMYLHCPTAGEFTPALTLGTNLPKQVAGQPAVYMWKDLIHVGDYQHPTKRFRLPVDASLLNTWADNFRLMKSRGVEVPINVDHSEAADDNRGFLIEVKRESGKLKGLCQFIGQDAALTAARNRVSVGIDEDFKDGEGRKYSGGVIRHVALTPVPVVPDQQPFTIAASRAAPGGDVLTLAAAEPPYRSPSMSKMLPASEETLNTLHKHVPGLADAPDDEKLSRVGQHLATVHGHLKNLMSMVGGADIPGDTAAMLSRVTEKLTAQHNRDIEDAGGATAVANLSVAQIADRARERRKSAFDSVQETSRLRERLEDKDKQITSLSAATVKPLDPENQQSVIEAAGVLAETCVAMGGITPVVKDKLMSLLTKDGTGKVNTLAMSSAANAGNGPLVLSILRALKDNKRPALDGEKTGLQTLSRDVPDGQPAAPADPVKKFHDFLGLSGARATLL